MLETAVTVIGTFFYCFIFAIFVPRDDEPSTGFGIAQLGTGYFHFCTSTPPRLKSPMSPSTFARSLNSVGGKVV